MRDLEPKRHLTLRSDTNHAPKKDLFKRVRMRQMLHSQRRASPPTLKIRQMQGRSFLIDRRRMSIRRREMKKRERSRCCIFSVGREMRCLSAVGEGELYKRPHHHPARTLCAIIRDSVTNVPGRSCDIEMSVGNTLSHKLF